MKAHQSTQPIFSIQRSELIFGFLMLIIIFLTSCNTSQASSKVNLNRIQVENVHETSQKNASLQGSSPVRIQQQHSNMSAPILITILLIISYGGLSGGLYLAQGIRK